MLRRLLLALLLLLAPAVAHAISLPGPLIKSITPSKARYKPGETVIFDVVLLNRTRAAATGRLVCKAYARGEQVGGEVDVPYSPLGAGAQAALQVRFALGVASDYRGYLVVCNALDGGGDTVDTASGAIDVSSDWAKYARECMWTQYAETTDVEADVRGLNAYGCNVYQYMDVYWKSHWSWNGRETWPNLENETISGKTVRASIDAAFRAGAAPLFYTGWGFAFDNFQTDGSGVPLSWGLFNSNCGANGGTCTLGDIKRSPPASQGNFPCPHWNACFIAELDPTNRNWWGFWTSEVRQMIDGFGFAGCQIDNAGDLGAGYRATGAAVAWTHAISNFMNANLANGCRRGVFNDIFLFNNQDAIDAAGDFFYAERHPEFGDASTYTLLHDSTGVLLSRGARGINYAIYMDEDYSSKTTACSTFSGPAGPGPNRCSFNEPGLRYMWAHVLAQGAWNNNIISGAPPDPTHPYWSADDPQYISAIAAKLAGQQLAARPSTTGAVLDYVHFGIAHEKEFRDKSVDVDNTHPASGTATGTSDHPQTCALNTRGPANTIYAEPRSRPGLQMLHLINQCALSNGQLNPQDRSANYPAAPSQFNIQVKMYHSGGLTGSDAGRIGGSNPLYLSSPDIDHGTPQQLAYTKGSDDGGKFVTFTVPSLAYWDFIEIYRDDLSRSDYAND